MSSEWLSYRLHGWRLCSQLPLRARRGAGEGPADLTVSLQPDLPPPAGRLLGRHALPDGLGYRISEEAEGYCLHFFRRGDFRFTADLKSGQVSLRSDVSPHLGGILLAGYGMAFLLTLNGDCILHASSVVVDGKLLAFVGGSGSGKSSLAALLCAAGAAPFSDDTLRLLPTGEGVDAFQGIPELRLRQSAALFVAGCRRAAIRETVDQRLALSFPQRSSPDRLPLQAIILPRLLSQAGRCQVNRLPANQALLALSRHFRLPGLQERRLLALQFQALSEVVLRAPVYQALIPWKSPFAPDIAPALLRQVMGHK